MNILPKKSWHVLSRDNIVRVRRDEAQARAEEEEKASRAAIAEKEARLGSMRKRARERDGVEEGEEGGGEGGGSRKRGRKETREECSVTDANGHINFFTDLQKGIGLQVGNVEREKEMKQEQEKLEKRIGLLNYLVDKDKSDNVPWYIRSGKEKGRGAASVEESRRSAKAEARKELQDPLLEMRGHLETKRKREEMVGAVSRTGAPQSASRHSGGQRERLSSGRSEGYRERASSGERQSEVRHKSGKKNEKEEKKMKKKEKERERNEELEKLRRDRRKREEAERARSEALIRGLEGGGASSSLSQPEPVERGSGRYNSQFNPHLVRQKK